MISKSKLVLLFVACLLIPATFAGATEIKKMTPPKSSELSNEGFQAIEGLGDCVNRNGRLDVLMLIDSSRSLRQTDPNDLRADIFATSVAKLYSLSRDTQIRLHIATWADDYEVLQDWTNLNDFTTTEVENYITYIRNGIANAKNGQATDWKFALSNAKDELSKQKNSNPNTCQSIFWFTDGGIEVPLRDADDKYIGDANLEERRELNRNAIGEICGSDSITSQIYENPLIPTLKSSGVSILGILLKVNPNQNDLDLMKFFPVLVEGAGNVETSVIGGKDSTFLDCTKPSGSQVAGGVSIEATSADALNGAIDSILCSLRDCVNANPLNIDKSVGFFEIEVSSSDKDFNLLAPSGVVIRNGEPIEEWAKNLSMVQIPSGFFIRVIPDDKSIGLWKMENINGEPLLQPTDWSARVYSGIEIKVDKSILAADDGQVVKGRITQNDNVIDLSAFDSGWQLIGSLDSVTEEISVVGGEFAWNISTRGIKDSVVLNLELNQLISNTSHPNSDPTKYQYPNVKSTVVLTVFGDSYPRIDKLNPEISLIGDKSQTYVLNSIPPKSGGVGEVCLYPETNSAQSLRVEYEARCYEPGESIKINFTGPVSNGSSVYRPIIPVAFKNDLGEIVELEIEPKVLWIPPINLAEFGLWIAILVVLGFAGPLILLILLNARASRLHLKNLSRAQIPVLISRSSDFITINRINENESLANTNGFEFKDYESLPTGLDRARSFTSSLETLKGINPKNPFGAISASASVMANNSIVSNIAIGPKSSDGHLCSASINPNGLVLLILENKTLQELQSEERNFDILTKGHLISYSNLFSDDPNLVIEQINENLQINNSWLNDILKINLPKSLVDVTSSHEINEIHVESSGWGDDISAADQSWGSDSDGTAESWGSESENEPDSWR